MVMTNKQRIDMAAAIVQRMFDEDMIQVDCRVMVNDESIIDWIKFYADADVQKIMGIIVDVMAQERA